MATQEDLEQLKNERERQITRVFWLALEIALIFGIPAAIGAYIGKKILGGGAPMLAILAGTFILSWVILIKRLNKSGAKLKKLDDDIQAMEKELGIEPATPINDEEEE